MWTTIPARKVEGQGAEEECRQAGRLSWSCPFHPPPPACDAARPFTCPGRGWSARVSQLLVNTPLFKPLSQPCLCASERPSSWAWSGRSGWGRHRVGIGMGGCSPPCHLPMAQVRGSPVTPSPPSAQGCRDPEGLLCNVLFLKRGKKQTAGGLYGVGGGEGEGLSSPYRECCENN